MRIKEVRSAVVEARHSGNSSKELTWGCGHRCENEAAERRVVERTFSSERMAFAKPWRQEAAGWLPGTKEKPAWWKLLS